MPDLGITIDGRRYAGWKTASVHRSIEHIAGAFEVGLAETRPADTPARALRTGQRCTVDLDGDVVVTGWIDDVVPAWDQSSHGITVSGRDATGDLVDCAAADRTVQWAGRKLEQIAADICRPFGIAVRTEVDTGKPFRTEGVNPGESAFDAIESMCRQRAVLPISDGRGGLVFTRAGASRAAGSLQYAANLLAGEFTASDRDRFSTYIVRGQQDPTQLWQGAASTGAEGRATDPAVARYRPKIVIAEAQGDGVSFADRAKWEASVRAGRARSGRYTVQGWRDASGALWTPNTLVAIRDPFTGVDRDLLIAGVEYTRGDQGTRTVLSVVRSEAFQLIALPAPKSGGENDWGKL